MVPNGLHAAHGARSQQVSTLARDLLLLNLDIMQSKLPSNYRIGYWASYQALKLGHPEGATHLGYMHELGLGVSVDYRKAAYWYSTAIHLGQPYSANTKLRLANLIQTGKLGGGVVNLDRALQLLNDAEKIATMDWWSGFGNLSHDIRAAKLINTNLRNKESTQTLVQPDKLVQDLQIALNEKGFNAGIVDGFMGPQTQAAITEALRVLGMKSNGEPSNRLLNAVREMR